MANKRVVVFTENNARILVTADTAQYKSWPNAVIDPDLSAVKGFPPHLWKLAHGKVIPMTASEQEARERHISKYGANNTIEFPSKKRPTPRPAWLKHAAFFAAGATLSALIPLLKGVF